MSWKIRILLGGTTLIAIVFLAMRPKKSPKIYGEMKEKAQQIEQRNANNEFMIDSASKSPILKDSLLSELELWAIQSEYDSVCNSIELMRTRLADSLKHALSEEEETRILEQARSFLFSMMSGEVFPLWFGTAWDFNGITETPQSGQIACGYFVSTTLKHVGFKMNRYKVAQQASEIIVKSLCSKEQVVEKHSLQELMAYVRSSEEELFIVGLDNHVGFLEKSADGTFFTHSNYMDPVAVEREKAIDSDALSSSNRYVVGHFLRDERNLRRWLTEEAFSIYEM